MALSYVEPLYIGAKERILYSRAYGRRQYLDITANPVRPSMDMLPWELNYAFASVVTVNTDMRKENPDWDAVSHRLQLQVDPGYARKIFMETVTPCLTERFPELKGDKHKAYICPVVSCGDMGYQCSYVVAWDKTDALTVAEYLAGGRAAIYLDLVDVDGETINSELIGRLSYSDIEAGTDAYRQIIEGGDLVSALWKFLDTDDPDLMLHGPELLKTFRKMS